MITLTPNSEVLTCLQKAFPKPPKSAERALAKYVSVLEHLIFQSLQRGQTAEERKLNLLSISLHQLANAGGRIGPRKLRVHKWLKDNGLELVETVVTGDKFKGTYSLVKLSKLVTISKQVTPTLSALSTILTDADLQRHLTGTKTDNEILFKRVFPELELSLKFEDFNQTFDFLPVDIESLKAFIVWLLGNANLFDASKRSQILTQAKMILSIASVTGGMYPQRRKLSPFGRTYYEGVSVQNMHKELRRAVLGDCWEYDIRSSVVAWKMGFAECLLSFEGLARDVRKSFPATTLYLEDKQDFMSTVRYFTFDGNTSLTTEFQLGLIKQALTAIGFGAKIDGKGWSDGSGVWRNPALADILRNAGERARFLADPSVSAFIAEQKRFDNFLISKVKRELPQLLELPVLKSPSGRISKAKVISYLYQHAETAAMDCALSVAARYGHKPVARVHDAVFFRNRLGAELKSEIQFVMQESTANPYWCLTAKQIKGYTPVFLDEVVELELHRERIAAEELRAAQLSHVY
jgi:hypothetical protein